MPVLQRGQRLLLVLVVLQHTWFSLCTSGDAGVATAASVDTLKLGGKTAFGLSRGATGSCR